MDPMLVFEFIHRIMDILTDYLGEVSESSIRENFVTVYQVGNSGCCCCMVMVNVILTLMLDSCWRK